MAGNDWINSYLEAILDVDSGGIHEAKSSLLLRERGRFSPARYFVEEVISGFDETDLIRSWACASSIHDSQERNTRLENMSWRIWNLARKKKQIEYEEARRKMKKFQDRERARNQLKMEMSQDLSEGENEDMSPPGDEHGVGIKSFDTCDSPQEKRKLYIVLISLHGLIRGENMELGRDSDTGGQVKYIVELARALGEMPSVYRVDLLTRQVSAPDIDWTYSEPTEMLNLPGSDNIEHDRRESGGAYIIRIPFGPKDKYVPKELLWPHIPEFVDVALKHIVKMSKVLGEETGKGRPLWPIAVHGHYADAGNSAALLSGALNVPMVFTGHSLGRDKLEQLLKQGRQSRDEINASYKIMRRIEAEEICVDVSEIIITSTRQEIEEQWRLYDGFDPVLERKLRAKLKSNMRCFGRWMPRMHVIPPGMEFHHILDKEVDIVEESSKAPDPPIWSEIKRFLSNPLKPMILALARPDPKKNLVTLIKAFGESQQLRELANLTLIMGNRNEIDEMSATNSSVLLSILKLIDKHDLYGQVAYPKHHKQYEVPDIYRLAARTKGVFINPAIIEPFGLTLIEAAAYGLPMVATKNGGPVDIHRVLDNGLLVDPHDQKSIADALLKLVADKHLWNQCKENGLHNIHQYSWPEHCKAYLARLTSCKQRHPEWQEDDEDATSDNDSPGQSLRDMKDMSLNLKFVSTGDKNEGSGNIQHILDSINESSNDGKSEKPVPSKDKASENVKFSILRKRKVIFVIAIDYNSSSDLTEIMKVVVEVGRKENKSRSPTGFILSTALTILEIQSLLESGGLNTSDFDAFICNSGGELYYPSDQPSSSFPFVADSDYSSHIDYRWGGEDVGKTLLRWFDTLLDKKKGKDEVFKIDESGSSHCYMFQVLDPKSAPPIREIRRFIRIQALRSHAIHCRSGTRLNVIPVLASRSQALRYLFVRWGIDLSKVVTFVGENGDSDYEGLVGGAHKTVILKGVCGSPKSDIGKSYPLDHVLPTNTPNITQAQGCSRDDIHKSLTQLGVFK